MSSDAKQTQKLYHTHTHREVQISRPIYADYTKKEQNVINTTVQID